MLVRTVQCQVGVTQSLLGKMYAELMVCIRNVFAFWEWCVSLDSVVSVSVCMLLRFTTVGGWLCSCEVARLGPGSAIIFAVYEQMMRVL